MSATASSCKRPVVFHLRSRGSVGMVHQSSSCTLYTVYLYICMFTVPTVYTMQQTTLPVDSCMQLFHLLHQAPAANYKDLAALQITSLHRHIVYTTNTAVNRCVQPTTLHWDKRYDHPVSGIASNCPSLPWQGRRLSTGRRQHSPPHTVKYDAAPTHNRPRHKWRHPFLTATSPVCVTHTMGRRLIARTLSCRVGHSAICKLHVI